MARLNWLRNRFWAEMGLGIASLAFAVLTKVWRDWIEIVFRVDPDHHSGSLEIVIVAVSIAVSLFTLLAARLEWRKASGPAAATSA